MTLRPENHFAHASAAARYARSRPFFHPIVMERIRLNLRLKGRLPVGVDVGCGTGQSSLALTELVDQVLACDIAYEMLAHAPEHPFIRFEHGAGERIPFETQIADLLTVSQAFHWLERAAFLREAHRVLKPGGVLAIYWNDFYGEMRENPDYRRWVREVYLARYPKPPRYDQPFTDEEARQHGFVFISRERYTNVISYTPELLAQLLMTHSNIIARVEGGHETWEEAASWLVAEFAPFFTGPAANFRFGGDIFLLRAVPGPG